MGHQEVPGEVAPSTIGSCSADICFVGERDAVMEAGDTPQDYGVAAAAGEKALRASVESSVPRAVDDLGRLLHDPRLRRYAASLASLHDPEDLLQILAEKTLVKGQELSTDEFVPWAMRVMRNSAIDATIDAVNYRPLILLIGWSHHRDLMKMKWLA